MARTAVVPETIDYPESDGLPMAESDFQFWPILYAGSALANHYRARDDVYVAGNLLLYYEEGNRKASVAPDVFAVFGVAKHLRRTYLVWQEGKAPDFVLEIASSSTYRTDRGGKRDTYAKMGVSEYWLYDPTGDYLAPRLQGFRLVEKQYDSIPVMEGAAGALTGHSEVLALELRLYPDDRFRFYDPVSDRDLLSREEAEDQLQASEAARNTAEDQLQASEAARNTLEARVRQLERRLRRDGQEQE